MSFGGFRQDLLGLDARHCDTGLYSGGLPTAEFQTAMQEVDAAFNRLLNSRFPASRTNSRLGLDPVVGCHGKHIIRAVAEDV